jgi:hypothetical protein
VVKLSEPGIDRINPFWTHLIFSLLFDCGIYGFTGLLKHREVLLAVNMALGSVVCGTEFLNL